MATYSVERFTGARAIEVASSTARETAIDAAMLAAVTSGANHYVYLTNKSGKRTLAWKATPEVSAAAIQRKAGRAGNPGEGAQTVRQWVRAVNMACTKKNERKGFCSRSSEPEVIEAVELIRATPAAARSEFGRQQQAARRRNPPPPPPRSTASPSKTKLKAGAFTKNPAGRKRANPSEADEAAEVYEEFHGKPSEFVTTLQEKIVYPGDLAELGTLISLAVAPPGTDLRGKVECQLLKFRGKGVTVAGTGNRKEILFAGGDQSVDADQFSADAGKGQIVLGTCVEITYKTTKAFHDFQPIEYFHEFGEETGVRPLLAYDTRSERLYLIGGAYFIKPEGIRN
jgi:hypothetical protein